jgi:hypothetical protein
MRDPVGTDTRFAGTRCRTPGGVRISEENLAAPRDRDSEGQEEAGGLPPTRSKPRGGGARKTRARRGGRKTPGGDRIPREDRATLAGFGRGSGNGLPRSARPGRRARTQGGSGRRVRSSQRPAGRPAERRRPCRGRGNLRREESHERYRLKHGGRVTGGRKRQEGGKP